MEKRHVKSGPVLKIRPALRKYRMPSPWGPPRVTPGRVQGRPAFLLEFFVAGNRRFEEPFRQHGTTSPKALERVEEETRR